MHTTVKKRTLKQVVLVSVSLLVLILLGISASLNFANSKAYVEEQLARHSQDAATFLGLALSSQQGEDAFIAQERMVDAIFDSGDYMSIQLRDHEDRVSIDRQVSSSAETVPQWFQDRMALSALVGEATVMSGWSKTGSVHVQANPGLAERELWVLFKAQLGLFFGVVSVGLLALYIVLRKLLAPLAQLEMQAQRIASRSFDQLMQPPSTRELDAVVRSMNDMSKKLKVVFDEQLDDIERLRDQARKDPLTGLFNREGFDARLKADLADPSVSGYGVLMLVMINDFGQLNIDHGRQAADDLLLAIANAIREHVVEYRGTYTARRTGAQFSVFLPSVSADDAERVAQKIIATVLSHAMLRKAMRDDWINIGLASVDDADTVKNLFSKSDLALRQAQEKGVSGWRRYASQSDDAFSDEVRQASHWQKILQGVLAENSIILYEQPVQQLSDGSVSYKQLLSRIEVEGQLIVASTFLPMAKRFGLMGLFDQMVIETVLTALQGSTGKDRYNITLSESSIVSGDFIAWLRQRLPENREALSRIAFEVPEHVLGFGEQVLIDLCALGSDAGFNVCIDRFGVSAIPFSYLQRVNVSTLKIDSSFIRGIHENKESQFFVRAASQIAHSQNIEVVAIGVETEEELAMIRELGVDAATGFFIQRPSTAQF